NPVAAAYHRAVLQPVGEADARRKQMAAHLNTDIVRLPTSSANQDHIRRWIVALDTTRRPPNQRIELIPQPEIYREFAAYLPAVAHIPAKLPLARIHLLIL